jgi:hypothetical protein
MIEKTINPGDTLYGLRPWNELYTATVRSVVARGVMFENSLEPVSFDDVFATKRDGMVAMILRAEHRVKEAEKAVADAKRTLSWVRRRARKADTRVEQATP